MGIALTTRGRRHLLAIGAGAGLVALVTGVVFGARTFAPVLSLGALYVVAVLPIAILFGTGYAVGVAVASMLAFNFFFLPPTHTLALRDSANWFALAVYLVVAFAAGELAGRARRRATEAEQREREAVFLAEVSAALLEAERVQDQLKEVAQRAAAVLGLPAARIELESVRRAEPREAGADLRSGHRHVGRVFFERGAAEPDAQARDRILAPLASLLGVALDRERLARRALEAETLRRSDAVKTAVLRSVSHDLRSPLTAIRAAAEGLDRADLSLAPEDRSELLETIRTETVRLERVVTKLIDLSRLEVGAAEPRRELWTVDDLIARALETLGVEAERVEVTLPPEPTAVRADGAQIERALVNLIENALKFTPADASVAVEAVEDGGEVAVHVRDRGPGLRRGELERVFEPFARGAAGGTSSGSGLGLAIVRGFAEVNGGRVQAESSAGEGATFTIVLPRADVPARVRS